MLSNNVVGLSEVEHAWRKNRLIELLKASLLTRDELQPTLLSHHWSLDCMMGN